MVLTLFIEGSRACFMSIRGWIWRDNRSHSFDRPLALPDQPATRPSGAPSFRNRVLEAKNELGANAFSWMAWTYASATWPLSNRPSCFEVSTPRPASGTGKSEDTSSQLYDEIGRGAIVGWSGLVTSGHP